MREKYRLIPTETHFRVEERESGDKWKFLAVFARRDDAEWYLALLNGEIPRPPTADSYRIQPAVDGWFEVDMRSPVFDAWCTMGRCRTHELAETLLKSLKAERLRDAG